MTPRRWFAVLRLATAALGVAILLDAVFVAWVNVGFGATVAFLSSFTALSNIFAAVCFAVAGVAAWRTPADSAGLTLYRAANATYTVGMSILFLSIYGPAGAADGTLFQPGTIVLHVVVPLVALVDWLFSPGSARLRYPAVGAFLLFPLCWFVYTFARAVTTQMYVYDFLDPAIAGPVMPYVSSAIALAEFTVVGLLAVGVNRFRTRKSLPADSRNETDSAWIRIH
jgi:hypothetical protein